MRALTILALLLAAACTPAGPSAGPAEETPAGPTLSPGPLSRDGEAAARTLYEEALDAVAAGRLQAAEEAASRVVEDYPASRVSVDALWLRARIRAGGAGEARGVPEDLTADGERLSAAAADLRRLIRVLPVGDSRETPARMTLGRALAALGEGPAALRTVLALPAGAPADAGAGAGWVRRVAQGIPAPELARVLEGADSGQPLRIPVLVAYATSLRLAGDEEGARRFAESALEAGAGGADGEVARALAEGRALPRGDAGPVPVGLVLPLGGSPAFQRFAVEVREGVEAAIEAWGLTGEVELLVLDDGGDAGTAASLVRSAEDQGAVAVVGLLDDVSLEAAARSRDDVPLISPTAYDLPTGEPALYSINAFDPGAAEALAEWAAGSGIRQVAIIHASRGASADEARLFSQRFQDLGGSVLRSFAYEPGATFWESQILAAARLEPEALVLPVPPEDLPGMAPQVTFFGLDTLGIRILGTGGWTDPRILREVDPRHTNGVVVATPVRPDSTSEGYVRFREAYERRFRRSLVDGTIPALGYDAASLVLQGVWAGAGRPAEVATALERVQGLRGATGTLSVVAGHVTRLHHVVCLEDRGRIPIQAGELPVQRYRAYPPDEETGVVPEGPGRPNGFACPAALDSPAPAHTPGRRPIP